MASSDTTKPIAGLIISTRNLPSFTLTETLYPRGVVLPSHAHDNTYLTFVIDGLYEEGYSNTTDLCKPGTLRGLPAGESHVDRYPSGARCLHISIGPEILARAQEYHATLDKPGPLDGVLVQSLGMRLYREFREGEGVAALAIEGLVLEVLAESARRGRSNGPNAAPPWLEKVEDMLRSSLAARPTLDEVASAAGVHPVHVCREFRKHYHSTMGEYVRRLRVERARELLADPRHSLAEIASACGFSDQSHFSAVFKRFAGLSPAKFRLFSKS